jgi:hypothetical protein
LAVGLLARFLPLLCHAWIDNQPIDIPTLVGLRQPRRVHRQRDRGIPMAKLRAHVGGWGVVLKQQRRERVAHLVRTAAVQVGLVQDLFNTLRTVDSSSGVPSSEGKIHSGRGSPSFNHFAPSATPPAGASAAATYRPAAAGDSSSYSVSLREASLHADEPASHI